MGKGAQEQQSEMNQANVMDWLSYLNPLNWPWGTIIMLALGLPAIYKFLHSETAHKWFGEMDWLKKVDAFVEDKMPWLSKMLHIDTHGAMAAAVDGLSDADFRKALGDDLPEASKDVVVKYRKQFTETVKGANNGGISKELALNDKSIYKFLTSDDAEVQNFVKALLPTLGGNGQGNNTARAKVLESIKTIINDESRLNTLLSDKYRKRTIALMLDISGDHSQTVEQVEQQLKMGMQDGKATPLLQKALIEKLDKAAGTPPTTTSTTASTPDNGTTTGTPNTGVSTTGVSTTGASTTGASTEEMVKKMLSDPNTTAEQRQQIVGMMLQQPAALVGAENVTAFATMRQTLGDEKIKVLLTVATNPYASDDARMTAISTAAMGDLPTLKAFKAFAEQADVTKLPDQLQGPVALLKEFKGDVSYLWAMTTRKMSLEEIGGIGAIFRKEDGAPADLHFVMGQLLNKDNRDLIRKAGVNNVSGILTTSMPQTTAEEKAAHAKATLILTPQNLTAFTNAAEIIGAHTKELDQKVGGNLASAGAGKVLSAMLTMVTTGQSKDFNSLPPELIAGFFSDPTYRGAVEGLLAKGTGITIPGTAGAALAAVRDHWGTLTPDQSRANKDDRDGWGLVEVLSNKDAVKNLQESAMHGQVNWWMFGISPALGVTDIWKHWAWKFGTEDKFSDNKDHLLALQKVLSATNVATGTTVTPNATANKQTPVKDPHTAWLTGG